MRKAAFHNHRAPNACGVDRRSAARGSRKRSSSMIAAVIVGQVREPPTRRSQLKGAYGQERLGAEDGVRRGWPTLNGVAVDHPDRLTDPIIDHPQMPSVPMVAGVIGGGR
jgi:hypothetical protein